VSNIDKAIKELNKAYGDNILVPANQISHGGKVSTGSISLDWGIGGGIPLGRVTEFYGYPSAGKTLLTMRVVRNFQAVYPDKNVAWVDTEQSWDDGWSRQVGLDTDKMYIAQPDTGNQAFDIIDSLIRTSEFSLIVLDSLGATAPQEEIEVSMAGTKAAGLKARMGNWGFRKIQAALNYSGRHGQETAVIIINHIYMGLAGFHPTKETPGGKGKEYADALKVELFVRKELCFTKEEDPNEDQYGQRVGYFVKKSKVGIPHRKGEFEIFIQPRNTYQVGDFSLLEYVPFLTMAGVVQRAGSWFTFPDGSRVQGADGVANWLQELDEDEKEEYRQLCLQRATEVVRTEDEQGPEQESGEEIGSSVEGEDG